MEEKKVKKIVEDAVIKKSKEDKIEEVIIEKTAEETTAEIKKMLNDAENIALAEAVIQNNEIEFEHDGVTYRVRKSTYAEKQEANKFRMKKYIELLRDKDCLLEKDLKALYKERGVDIESFDKQILELTKQQQTLMLDLGEAIKKDKPKPELEKYKEEILALMTSIQGLSIEKQQLLEFSLENRVLMDVYSYMIWNIAEKKIGPKWVKIWNTYNDFISSDTNELLTKVTKNGAVIVTEELTNNITG